MRSFLNTCRNHKDNSALAERFEQILSQKIDESTKSFIDQNPTLQHLYTKYHKENDAKTFEAVQLQNNAQSKDYGAKFQKEIGLIKSANLIKVKDSEAILHPWTGTERVQDTTLRMLVDSAPKPKRLHRNKTLFTAPKTLGTRVTDAKEGSLDYKLSKVLTPEEKEKEEFREMYQERLLGPAMFAGHNSPTTASGMIGNLASARINSVINRKTGKFESPDMEKVRGKPLDRERLANSTNSNYFMNQILKNQECLPVWIESQQGIDKEISVFRLEIQKKIIKAIIDSASAHVGTVDADIIDYIITADSELLAGFARKELLKRNLEYIKAKIDAMNKGVRDYNLQCPSTGLHKWKLTQDNEIDTQIKNVTKNIEPLVIEHLKANKQVAKSSNVSETSLLGLFETRGSGSRQLSESTPNDTQRSYLGTGLWRMLRNALKT
ncbi:hypothetical protein METBIDRAFT_36175 [Metschnikowia bicuspidata var. bicuspidata NRRL YB-4993]|uniref:DnaJ homologue subfamily C member 28 conserved domain-containing protein n=1 Tax=Metschnikowia bicuspidata var. bicuspidata NRRL YB-4993 TaxID=869754 RepID=A0A1A0HKN8_9ASCO|nr:hypothetical protein METBIDRAFT_36175 [Metschnikowia bicuspidata var. bicuspidata NRRL YB-4993]OBA24556.1 hypothetical protein METBIDRAFT_36175 [Metschnikowia bicuspidata var. bicuspidata NRRL YB-4993]